MNTIRCGHCARKLGEGEYISLAIKCPRCGTLNHFTIPSLRATRSVPACQRASDKESPHGWHTDHSVAGRQTPTG
ncbi:Com family DNA-binding transcriptional regulator [Glaciimonas sp. Gout2]|uniref:Com family DNA-binding transcriptional regulator n=1 Tax=unclassified Glaciimonas TaxID=2644401 RepID=UPI002B22B630|nr:MULTISPECIES: Com family DNA-binding transcriptional regulator [unclassified Glaciimonas]MEB0012571.1 Com family DNA-binding transcriptional regulator [Glaciimonas sp. Cout2]MEB0083922.1 Com family DNA-binding transcriptional regulator [Glaciimonas sp. Gout2]